MESPGAACLAEVKRTLEHFPDAPLKLEQRAQSLVITPQTPGSYPITVYDQGEDVMIAADRWHTHEVDPKQAAFAVLWLLTPYYRVIHELKGGLLVAVWIERLENEGWVPFEPVYFINPEYAPDWELGDGETYRHRIVQQNVLPSPVVYSQLYPDAVLDADGLPSDYQAGVRVVECAEPVGPSLFEPEDDEEDEENGH